MARPRVNQFAEDLGISRREALNLMNKGRRRSDGGSAVLESNMNKMKGYKEGGSETFSLTEEEELEMMGTNMSTFKKAMHDKAFGGEPMGSGGGRERAMEEKAMGGAMKAKGYANGGSCRGGGAAIKGTKFKGVF